MTTLAIDLSMSRESAHAPQPPAPTGYTIDELAAKTRVPSRTVRFYQSKGALMPPEIRGRVAFYGEPHIERLELIAKLQDRGLRIDAIGDLVRRIDKGEVDLAEWLGVEAEMQTPWASDQPRTLSEAELYALAGSNRPGLLADLVKSELVERKGDVFLVRSPGLLGMAMKLEAAGVDLETANAASAVLRKHLGRAVSDLIDVFSNRVKDGSVDVADSGALFGALRGAGTEAVRILFARAMEKSLRDLIASGKLASLSAHAKKKRKK